jgi:hypothetical protein
MPKVLLPKVGTAPKVGAMLKAGAMLKFGAMLKLGAMPKPRSGAGMPPQGAPRRALYSLAFAIPMNAISGQCGE